VEEEWFTVFTMQLLLIGLGEARGVCRSTSQGSFRQDNQDLQEKQEGFLDKIDKIVRIEAK
jgi:hypothetical protein